MAFRGLLACTFVWALAHTSTASTINVPADHATIQAAIGAAANGDEVIVGPGLYVEALDYGGKAITVRSSGGAAVTFINASSSAGSAVGFDQGEGLLSVMEGFSIAGADISGSCIKIQNASPIIRKCNLTTSYEVPAGGGALIENGSPAFVDCNFVSCSATLGGAIAANGGKPTILNCTFASNDATGALGSGGAIYLSGDASASIRNCAFNNNTATFRGGAIAIFQAFASITSSLIWENQSDTGGGVAVIDAQATLINCTIADNTATTVGGGISVGSASNECILTNSIVRRNEPNQIDDSATLLSVTFSNVTNGWSGQGNIGVNAHFVDADNGDYHLLITSPCIDAGNSALVTGLFDRDGNVRVQNVASVLDTGQPALGITIDIGAYELQPEAKR